MKPGVIHAIETAEPGGAETILVHVANGLRTEFEPTGVVFQEGWTSAELARLNIPVVHLPLHRSFDLGWVRRMARFIRDNNIRLIHSHEFTTNAYSLLAARMAGIPVICTIHGKNYYPDKYYRRLASRLTARYADVFVAVSEDLAKFLVQQVAIPRSRIKVVHNGIDTAVFDRCQDTRLDMRQQLRIPDDAYVIVVVAALFEMKGHKDLITAIKGLRPGRDNLRVLFVGDGDYRGALEKQVAENHLQDQVMFLGFRSDIPELLSASDLFVLPSYSEGLPVSVLEAMSSGLPVIATDVGGLREIVRDGSNAILVPPARPDVLADKILLVMKDEQLARRLASRGRDDVVENFDLGAMLATYRGLYEEITAM